MRYQDRFSSVEDVTCADAVRFLIAETQELVNQFRDAIERFPRANSIYRPFHPSYRPDIGAKSTRSQKAAIRWRQRLTSRNSVLSDYYDLLDRGNELNRYPLAGFGPVPNFGYRLTADD